MGDKELRAYRLEDVSLHFTHRGLLLKRDDGASMLIGWFPTGWDLVWNARQPCRCSSGTLSRLALDGNQAVLSCNICSHRQFYYADVGVAEMALR